MSTFHKRAIYVDAEHLDVELPDPKDLVFYEVVMEERKEEEEAGAHFTSRDIIYLMCDLLISNDDSVFDGKTKTIYENCTTSLIRVAAA